MRRLISRFHRSLEAVNDTYHDEFAKYPVPHSGSHGVSVRVLD